MNTLKTSFSKNRIKILILQCIKFYFLIFRDDLNLKFYFYRLILKPDRKSLMFNALVRLSTLAQF